jgi:hypothetical protein
VKQKTPFQVEGVYEITCETCGKKYIGETGRSGKTRLEGHQRAIRLQQPPKSAEAEHGSPGHATDVQQTKAIAKGGNFKSRLIRAALEIRKRRENFNREGGHHLLNRKTNKMATPSSPSRPEQPSPP